MNKELTLKRNNDINFEQHLQENLAKLDDSQSAAVQSDGANILIKAPAGSGKALKNGTHVLTIQGWKPIECLTMKDLVAAEDGKFYSIIGIYPQGLKQIYKITFSDKSEIQCSGDHIWTWQSSEDRCRHKDRWRNSTTEELMKRPLQLNKIGRAHV